MPTVGRMKNNGDLLLAGEVKERWPAVMDGLKAHYPLDGDTKRYVPPRIRYIRDHLGNGSTANSSSHWISIQAFDENGVNIALNKPAVNSTGTVAVGWTNDSLNTNNWSQPGLSGGQHVTVDLEKLYNVQKIIHWHYYGDSRKYYKSRVSVSEDGIRWFDVFDSEIEGEYNESSKGHVVDLVNPGRTIAPKTNTNTTLTDEYIAVEEATTNCILSYVNGEGDSQPWGTDTSLVTFRKTDEIRPLFGKYVTRFRKSDRTFGGNLYINGSGKFSSTTSTVWTFSCYLKRADGKPVTKVGVMYLYSTSENTRVSESSIKIEPFLDGWYRVSGTKTMPTAETVNLVGMGTLDGATDWYIDGWQLEPKAFATSYVDGSRAAGRFDIPFTLKFPYTINVWHKGNKPLANIVDQPSSPMIFQLNDYHTNASVSFWNYSKSLVVYIKGNTSSGWTTTKNYHTFTPATWDNVEHMYTLVAVDSRTFKVYIDGVYKGEQTSSEDVTNISFLSMGNTSQPNAKYRDLSTYSRELTGDEVMKLYGKTIGPTKDGDLSVRKIIENPIGIPSDVLHIPLDFTAVNRLGNIGPSSEGNVLYEDGSAWVGTEGRNFVINPAGNEGISPYTSNAWDASLHPNAVRVNNWGAGLNTGVPSSEIGYHAFWTNEGVDGGPCIKFIDRNDQFGLGHRWLGVSAGMGIPNVLGWKAGDKFVISWYQKSDVVNKGASVGIYHKSLASGGNTFGTSQKTISSKRVGVWERMSFTYVISTDMDLSQAVSIYVYGNNNSPYGTVWVDNFQIEKNDYVQPFVNGSVGKGNLAFNFYRDYELDWSKDWSIVYWKKPMGTATNNLTGYNIESLGCNSNSVGGGYFWLGKPSGENKVNLSTPGTFNPTDYFDNWRMVSLTCTGATITIKEWQRDGTVHTRTLATTTTVPNYYVTQFGYDFKFGWDDVNVNNNYYKDLIVAKRAFTQKELETMYNVKYRAKSNNFQIQGSVYEGQTL